MWIHRPGLFKLKTIFLKYTVFVDLKHILTNIHTFAGCGKIALVNEVCVSVLFL